MGNSKGREIQAWLKGRVSPFRFQHIQGVARTAKRLAARYGLSMEKAQTAAWLHDCAKEMTRREMKEWLRKAKYKLDAMEELLPGLWHPHAGAAVAALRWGIRDAAILEAIRCHTLGKAGMGPLAQALFVADFIEPGRKFSEAGEARKAARLSLRQGVLTKASMTIQFLFREKRVIHPRLLETWNYYAAGTNETI